MRVITGSARGRRLLELEGMETRPTTGRVKEGVFSALQFDIEGRRVLDLFAGTGQMGIECLSRGAVSAVFVEMPGTLSPGPASVLTWCSWTRPTPPDCWRRCWSASPRQDLTFSILMV